MEAQLLSQDQIQDRNLKEAEELIAEICINTSDEDIKQVVRKYLNGSTVRDIEKR